MLRVLYQAVSDAWYPYLGLLGYALEQMYYSEYFRRLRYMCKYFLAIVYILIRLSISGHVQIYTSKYVHKNIVDP